MLMETYQLVDKRTFWVAFIVLMIVITAEVIFTTLIPVWREYFYDVLEVKDYEGFQLSLVLFTVLILSLGGTQGTKLWLANRFSVQIREGATELFLRKWNRKPAPNLTQAFSDSLYKATEMYVEIAAEIYISGMIAASLVITNLDKPVVLIGALIYTVSISVAAALFNKPLIISDMRWQEKEGEFRETLQDVSTNLREGGIRKVFSKTISAYLRYIKIVMWFTLFSRVKGALATLIPYIMLAGQYFGGSMTLGEFMSGVAVFELIVINTTILVILYPKLTKARAGLRISEGFYDNIK